MNSSISRPMIEVLKSRNDEPGWPFQADAAQQLFDCLPGKRKKPKFPEFRKVYWHFWKPKNEVDTLRYLSIAAIALLVIGTVGLFLTQVDPIFHDPWTGGCRN